MPPARKRTTSSEKVGIQDVLPAGLGLCHAGPGPPLRREGLGIRARDARGARAGESGDSPGRGRLQCAGGEAARHGRRLAAQRSRRDLGFGMFGVGGRGGDLGEVGREG